MERLNIPANIPLRWELWRGFGKQECIITLCVLGLSVAAGFVYHACAPEDEMAVLKIMCAIILLLFATVALVIKIDLGQSLLDYVRRAIRYRRSQQVFHYRSKEEITLYVEEEGKTA